MSTFEKLKYKLYAFLSNPMVRACFGVAIVFLLSGCEGDSSAGGEGNYKEQASCWQTAITGAVVEAVDYLYNKASTQIAKGGADLILISFAVWMAFKLLRVLGSFKEENIGEVWTEITHKLFLCAFCAYLVGSGHVDEAIRTFVAPIYVTILELGIRILSTREVTASLDLGSYFGTISYTWHADTCPVDINMEPGKIMSAIQPASDCMVCGISDRLNSGISMGIRLISTGDIAAIFVGLLMLVLFTATKFGFVLYLIDGLFRLNFAAFLVPVLIAGVPFSYTRKWSKHALLMFLNSSGVMMFIALLIGIVIGALENIMTSYTFDETSMVGMGEALLAMIMITLLLVNVPGLGVALSDKFIGGGGGVEFQKKITKFIVNAVKKLAAEILSASTTGATEGATDTLEKFEEVREVVDNIKQVKQSVSSALNNLAGYNDD